MCNQFNNEDGLLHSPRRQPIGVIIFCNLVATDDTRNPKLPPIALAITTVAGRPVVVAVVTLLPIVSHGT